MPHQPMPSTMVCMKTTLDSIPTVIVGIEHSEPARDALALAGTLARALGARLILASVYLVEPRRGASGAYARALEAEAEAALEWAAGPLGGVPHVECRTIASPSVAQGLQELAEAEGALTIVVGPSQRGRLGRLFPGSVGQRLLHGAPCPVAIAPRGHWSNPRTGIRSIGVGYVPVPDGWSALRAACALAGRLGATLQVLSVAEPPAAAASIPYGWGYADVETTSRDALVQDLRRALDEAGEAVAATGDVVEGYADDELARLSEAVDLLICGSRGYGPVDSVLLGSVSTSLLRKASCPILVIPRGADDSFRSLAGFPQPYPRRIADQLA
jgi:nucleotide-binding universal stress UspA family protein